MSPELKESRSCTYLELEIECYTSAIQDCEVFIESEVAPLEAVPLTEDLMQTGARHFGTKDLVVLKDKRLVLAL